MLDLKTRRRYQDVNSHILSGRSANAANQSLEDSARLFVDGQTSAVGVVSQLAGTTPDMGVWSLLKDVLVDADRSTGYVPSVAQIEGTPVCRRWYISHYSTIQTLLMRNSTLRAMATVMGWLEKSYCKVDADWEHLTSAPQHLDGVFQCLRAGKPLDALRVAEGAENWPLCCELDRSYMLAHTESWYENTAHVPLFGEYARGNNGAEWVSNEHRLTHLADLFDMSNDPSIDRGTQLVFATLSGNEGVIEDQANLTHWRDQVWAALRCCLVSVIASEVSTVTGDMSWRGTNFHTYVTRCCPPEDTTYSNAIGKTTQRVQSICSDFLKRSSDEDEMWQARLIQHALCASSLWDSNTSSTMSAFICCSLDKANRETLCRTTPQGASIYPQSLCTLANSLLEDCLTASRNQLEVVKLCAQLFDLLQDNSAYINATSWFFCALRSQSTRIEAHVEVKFIDACSPSLEHRNLLGVLKGSIAGNSNYTARFETEMVDALFLEIAVCRSVHDVYPLLDRAVEVIVGLVDTPDIALAVKLVDKWLVTRHDIVPTRQWEFWVMYVNVTHIQKEVTTGAQALAVLLKDGHRTRSSVDQAQKLLGLLERLYMATLETIHLGQTLAVTKPLFWKAIFNCATGFISSALMSVCAGSEVALDDVARWSGAVGESVLRSLPDQNARQAQITLSVEALRFLEAQKLLMKELGRRLRAVNVARQVKLVA